MPSAGDRLPRRIRRIVSRVLETDVRSWRRPAVGSVAETYVLDLEDEPNRVVCKIGGASVWTGDVIEPTVCRLAGERTPLAVPEVLASGRFVDGSRGTGRSGSTEAPGPLSRWALYEFLDGENPSPWYRRCDPAIRRRVVADAGAILGRLHAWSRAKHGFDRTGGLERDPDGATGLRLCDPIQPSVVDALSASRGSPRRPANARPVLCHGDFHPDNLLVSSDGSIAAVVDWGNAHVAPAEYAVARAEARFVDRFRSLPPAERTRLRHAFRRGYRERATLEDGYSDRAPIYKGLWLAQSSLNLATVARSSRGRTQIRRQLRAAVGR
jgi:hypothetical protein